jgi:hypothetical protein
MYEKPIFGKMTKDLIKKKKEKVFCSEELLNMKRNKSSQVSVGHTYNPSYSGASGLKPAQANSS